jgi:F420-non-reducing hydrogenase iron-sulfur subunit
LVVFVSFCDGFGSVSEKEETNPGAQREPKILFLRISDFGFMNTPSPSPVPRGFQPKIAAFFCNWCTYTAADLAGVSRLKYAPNARIIRVMCSGRVDPQFVLEAFARGADGVLIGGCHPGDCHYVEGNYKCLRRFQLLKRLLADLGIEEQRLRLEWISASEGDKVKIVVNELVEQLKQLGPLGMPEKMSAWDEEMRSLAEEIQERERKEENEKEVAHAG